MKSISFSVPIVLLSSVVLFTSCTSIKQADNTSNFPETSFQDTISDLPDINTTSSSQDMTSVNADTLQNVAGEQGVPVRN